MKSSALKCTSLANARCHVVNSTLTHLFFMKSTREIFSFVGANCILYYFDIYMCIKLGQLKSCYPCIKSPASLEKAGQVRISGFLARLTGKMQPGLPGLVTSKAELSRQPSPKNPGLIQALKIQARLGRPFLNFQAKNL